MATSHPSFGDKVPIDLFVPRGSACFNPNIWVRCPNWILIILSIQPDPKLQGQAPKPVSFLLVASHNIKYFLEHDCFLSSVSSSLVLQESSRLNQLNPFHIRLSPDMINDLKCHAKQEPGFVQYWIYDELGKNFVTVPLGRIHGHDPSCSFPAGIGLGEPAQKTSHTKQCHVGEFLSFMQDVFR